MRKFLVLAFALVGFAQAQPVKFGFFDTPQERADKFKSGFSVGEVVAGKLEVGSRSIRLPAGSWKVAGVNSYVGTVKDIYSDDVRSNNPHGEIFLFQEENGRVQKIFVMTLPIGSVPNNSWKASIPSVCNPDWNNDSKYWQVARSLDEARLDCSIVRFGQIFSWRSSINDAAKFSLKKLGINYDAKSFYLIGQNYISRNSATYFANYAEFYSEDRDEASLRKESLDESRQRKVNEMIEWIEGYRVGLKQDI